MEDLLYFFESMPNWQKLVWILLVLSIFWILEGYYALVKLKYNKLNHAKTNLSLLGFVIIINFFFGLMTGGLFIWLENHQFGLLTMVELPIWIELLLSIMVLDLIAQYFVHFLLHKVKWMWRLHLIHHTDTHVDATTGTRHHPLDFIIRETFALIAMVIMGMPVAFYLIYRILSVFFTYFTHANISLPVWLDKTISYLFVTPNMHKFHHHYQLPWTDSNYGNMLSIWDRMFGTFVYDSTDNIRYGVDIVEDQYADNFTYQIKIPFNKNIKTKN
ncbi:sterol desaturase family protein [Christiangramia sp. SM2212]|uniref:Sterol desaturase family protein n=1 Tax=Christiangramia sediminicola TaxID=3073267 RepID=A0ABU1ESJ4_9FLAO|nr:sterol desaturase family protein [Christiangramia sp. SM2212]MDR5591352.1 sterol desaturase family protein [Christiangramia sp. SM2212]